MINYEEKLTPFAHGLRNIGSTCYFNTLMQCMLSLTSVHKTLNRMNNLLTSNEKIRALNKLYTNYYNNADINEPLINLHNQIINVSSSMDTKIKMRSNEQQDMSEGYMMLMNIIDDFPTLRNLFIHRQRTIILCEECNYKSYKSEIGSTFFVYNTITDINLSH